ncbi:MAG: alpha/beta hydrolase [Planctomycetaceae bacterium]|nr:alpha/beta hydrolase [Planctomycetaceae bacterium]
MRSSELLGIMIASWFSVAAAAEPQRTINVWPDLAPGETTRSPGEVLPRRATENPPATRIKAITQPQLELFAPPKDKQNGAVMIVCPGGGYSYCVIDKEGAEPAAWLNELGITALVLRYRTKDTSTLPPYERPLQDAQRAIRLVRQQAAELNIDPARVGICGFSAGGNLAALVATRFEQPAYTALDDTDKLSCRPDFALLGYPAYLYDAKTEQLDPLVTITAKTPPTFLLHTHDDGLTSLGPVYFYAALKRLKIPAELHVYQVGGHGYGLRPVAGANIDTWVQPAAAWLGRITQK